MRKKTEQELTLLMLKGHTPAQAAYEILYNGRYVTTDEIEELEELILKDFFVSVRYMRAVKHSNWPKLCEHITTNSINPHKELTEHQAASREEFVDALMFVRAYVNSGKRKEIEDKVDKGLRIRKANNKPISDNLLRFKKFI